ncbi:uncharacterized protein CDAR_258341 [Caerostris darwini]|uniref:Uncharacterized protein n=1 Tax=Caerostris darwini TaxID=1538125 RepID=A0AAV4UN13_9ARAC|nr:uncharacterized protein CDAR_258341 [Caerostris darwini]
MTVVVADIDCSQSPFNRCIYPKLFQMIPDSKIEYDKICPELKNYVLCLKEYQDTCVTENKVIFDREEIYHSIYNLFSELCDEGTVLNAVVTENLRCFNRTFSSTRCFESTNEVVSSYVSSKASALEGESHYNSVQFQCLKDILDVGCVIEDIYKNCGALAKVATLEFIHRSYFFEYSCSANDAKLIIRRINNYEMSEDQLEFLTFVLHSIIEKEDILPTIPRFK